MTANNLLLLMANDLADYIDKEMSRKQGVQWLATLKETNYAYRDFNLKDPAALLKDLARNGSSQIRQALNSRIERGFLKNYYDDINVLLGERNVWIHRQVQETTAELLDLVTTIVRVATPLGLELLNECTAVKDSILKPIEAVIPEAINAAKSEPEVQEIEFRSTDLQEENQIKPIQEIQITLSEIVEISANDSFEVGDAVTDRLLSHSYILHLNGEIRNRATDEVLSEINPQSAEKLGALLIARKPSGGRLRITEEGYLCAFFGDKWGYLATVSDTDWFPEHLSNSSHKLEKGK
jgi:predicted HTH domain antitoxin